MVLQECLLKCQLYTLGWQSSLQHATQLLLELKHSILYFHAQQNWQRGSGRQYLHSGLVGLDRDCDRRSIRLDPICLTASICKRRDDVLLRCLLYILLLLITQHGDIRRRPGDVA